MSPLATKILLTVVIEGLKILRRRYTLLSPEQRMELDKATKDSFNNAGNMGSGVGE
jgi:hypothetical protein